MRIVLPQNVSVDLWGFDLLAHRVRSDPATPVEEVKDAHSQIAGRGQARLTCQTYQRRLQSEMSAKPTSQMLHVAQTEGLLA